MDSEGSRASGFPGVLRRKPPRVSSGGWVLLGLGGSPLRGLRGKSLEFSVQGAFGGSWVLRGFGFGVWGF